MKPLKTIFLFLAVLVFMGAARKDEKKHHKKDNDSVTIEGKTFPLVVDEYDNWYIKQNIDSVHIIYIPANFETTEDESDN